MLGKPGLRIRFNTGSTNFASAVLYNRQTKGKFPTRDSTWGRNLTTFTFCNWSVTVALFEMRPNANAQLNRSHETKYVMLNNFNAGISDMIGSNAEPNYGPATTLVD